MLGVLAVAAMSSFGRGSEMTSSSPLQARANTPLSSADSPYGAAVISPLPSLQKNGLIVVSVIGLLSLTATSSLLCFFAYRFIFWRKFYRRYIGHNQYVVLMINLIVADLIQALGFLVSLRWIARDSLHASDPFCFMQGVWLQIGDPMSGMFVLSIAVHTYLHVNMNYQLSHRAFKAALCGLWLFGVLLVIIPIAAYGRYVWYPAVAWCWMTIEYKQMRLWSHYFWIFAAQFFTLLLYAILFFQLRQRIKDSAILGSSHTESLHRMKRVVLYMVAYPIVYMACSLPLAAGRMASAHGDAVSVLYYCVAGSLMACSGICDSVMYTLTRRSIVLEPEARINGSTSKDYNLSTRPRMHSRLTHGSYSGTVDAAAGLVAGPKAIITALKKDQFSRTRTASTEAFIPDRAAQEFDFASGHVLQQTTIEVMTEPANSSGESNVRSSAHRGSRRGASTHGI